MEKEKKEIGIEKLIELLNEYSKKKHNLAMRELNGELGLGFHYLNYGSSYSELFMISKKYGFIGWLVENEKIDFRKAHILHNARKDIQTDKVIMLLSIQDEPIRFLCEIIK